MEDLFKFAIDEFSQGRTVSWLDNTRTARIKIEEVKLSGSRSPEIGGNFYLHTIVDINGVRLKSQVLMHVSNVTINNDGMTLNWEKPIIFNVAKQIRIFSKHDYKTLKNHAGLLLYLGKISTSLFEKGTKVSSVVTLHDNDIIWNDDGDSVTAYIGDELRFITKCAYAFGTKTNPATLLYKANKLGFLTKKVSQKEFVKYILSHMQRDEDDIEPW